MLTRLLMAALGILLITACAERQEPSQQAAEFCAALNSVNRGEVDTSELADLAGHARVLETLLDVAPDTIEDDIAQFHAAFDNWAAAVDGDQTVKSDRMRRFLEIGRATLQQGFFTRRNGSISIPEPNTALMLGFGVIALAARARREGLQRNRSIRAG